MRVSGRPGRPSDRAEARRPSPTWAGRGVTARPARTTEGQRYNFWTRTGPGARAPPRAPRRRRGARCKPLPERERDPLSVLDLKALRGRPDQRLFADQLEAGQSLETSVTRASSSAPACTSDESSTEFSHTTVISTSRWTWVEAGSECRRGTPLRSRPGCRAAPRLSAPCATTRGHPPPSSACMMRRA